nr:hypothetical protein [Bradyrhizobium sp. MOS002]
MHRRENIGGPMGNVLRALRTLGEDGDKIVALPVHLNPEVRRQVLEILAAFRTSTCCLLCNIRISCICFPRLGASSVTPAAFRRRCPLLDYTS